jgi:hypothetical protein
MSVTDSKIIDSISIDPKGIVNLIISDHLEWDEKLEHLLILQNKINDYLTFIESGQIFTEYPTLNGKNIVINIFAKFIPNEAAETFLKMARKTIQFAGYDLTLSLIEEQ